MKVVANRTLSYRGARYSRGTVIDVPRKYGKLFVKLGQADIYTGAMWPEEVTQPPPLTPDEPAEPATAKNEPAAVQDEPVNVASEDEEIEILRKDYKNLTGEWPDGRWGVVRLQVEIGKINEGD